ncbi:ribonuclease H [Trifolium pratense]|uniref:Ribonuclease H n=1 Tax=Trifolium pratense TaxID=57577 RepID=A0A2K3MYY1_TRIPR|nr:ribonuclease H [Trifolium pratense]
MREGETSCIGNLGIAGFGGLIRNDDGGWIIGYHGHIGFSNILHAELLALLFGLQLAWDKGLSNIICYSDSLNVVKLVTAPITPMHLYAAILQEVKNLMNRNWTVQLRHTLREGNQSADFLAKMGSSCHDKLKIISAPPAEMLPVLHADSTRVSFVRS